MDLSNLEEKTVVKAHCGHFHSEADCEVVIVKIVKGKNCDLDSILSESAPKKQEIFNNTAAPNSEVVIPVVENRPIRKIMPPGIASMMMPPADAGLPAV